jgi:hypothetical protein
VPEGFIYEENSGWFYSATTNYYFDANSQIYYEPTQVHRERERERERERCKVLHIWYGEVAVRGVLN